MLRLLPFDFPVEMLRCLRYRGITLEYPNPESRTRKVAKVQYIRAESKERSIQESQANESVAVPK
jgi:hypothetical protein